MMGMSSPEWSRYMHDEVGIPMEPSVISSRVVDLVNDRYRQRLPLLPGAVEAVQRLAAHWPLGLASSSNRPVIDLVLELSGLTSFFAVTVSSEEVARGKPSPDVYLEAAARLGLEPSHGAAIEDSSKGLRSAAAAGLRVVAVPNPAYPPADNALALADVVVPSLTELTPQVITALKPDSRHADS
jgi:HAD superfamily hydrolase (TIGR01509 family)